MSWIDWLIVILPVTFVMGMAIYSTRFIRGVADFLSAGRICGRYVISVADVANGLSVITLVAYVEVHYKTGFAMTFWNNIIAPLGLVLTLTGYCAYRFRETRAMSLGQFLEMRYSRPLRIFAAVLRSFSEMLANMICPAVAARFFIYYLDLPFTVNIFGHAVPTFMLVVVFVLTLAVSIIWMGGTLALIITDTIQGLFCYPMLVIFTIFILTNFSWSGEIVPVMSDRAAGESFLNPYEVENLRDFNVLMLVVMVVNSIMHRASWIGAGNTTAARTPHEQKMASVLGAWRTGFMNIFYLLLAVMIITLLNHKHFAPEAKDIRTAISSRVAEEVVPEEGLRRQLVDRIAALPAHDHTIGVDTPLSQDVNLDTPYLDVAHETLKEGEEFAGQGNARFQEFRTLYHQIMMPVVMRHSLPVGMVGLFCLMMVLMMISTDDSRIYSASLTLAQDVVLPFKKGGFTPEGHIRMIRLMSVGVGLFWMFGSFFMAQLDYINLFIQIMTSLWLGGCGPVMIFGLYSRFGTTAGAFASLISGMAFSLVGIFFQRNWAGSIYPWLEKNELVDTVGNWFATLSGPFEPFILWRMDAVKFPINSYEILLMTSIATMGIYIVVSLLTKKEPFNIERMLHRGKYNVEGEHRAPVRIWSWRNSLRNAFSVVIGITPEYTRGDRIIAWSVFIYSFIYAFCIAFLGVVIWNWLSPWPIEWWGHYFFVVSLVVPSCVAAVSTVWFTIGGLWDLRRLFRDLRDRVANPLDDGRVEGNVSLADKELLEKIDREAEDISPDA